jgi:hypothetical protein
MLDISVAYNRYRFLGHEFLTWLWFVIEQDLAAVVKRLEQEPVSLELGDRIVLENKRNNGVETVTIKGDDAGLEEGMLALRKGAVVTELNLSCKSGDLQWRYTIKAESLHIVNLKAPNTGMVETEQDLEGAVLERAYVCEKVVQLTQNLFNDFIRLRVSDAWTRKVVPRLKRWIGS